MLIPMWGTHEYINYILCSFLGLDLCLVTISAGMDLSLKENQRTVQLL